MGADDAFDCTICMEIANHDGGCPASCNGCGAIYCSSCAETPTVTKSCAVCRVDGSKITANFVVKKMCGMLKPAPEKKESAEEKKPVTSEGDKALGLDA